MWQCEWMKTMRQCLWVDKIKLHRGWVWEIYIGFLQALWFSFSPLIFLLKKVLLYPSILSLPKVTCVFFSLPLVNVDNWNIVHDIPFNIQSALLQEAPGLIPGCSLMTYRPFERADMSKLEVKTLIQCRLNSWDSHFFIASRPWMSCIPFPITTSVSSINHQKWIRKCNTFS